MITPDYTYMASEVVANMIAKRIDHKAVLDWCTQFQQAQPEEFALFVQWLLEKETEPVAEWNPSRPVERVGTTRYVNREWETISRSIATNVMGATPETPWTPPPYTYGRAWSVGAGRSAQEKP